MSTKSNKSERETINTRTHCGHSFARRELKPLCETMRTVCTSNWWCEPSQGMFDWFVQSTWTWSAGGTRVHVTAMSLLTLHIEFWMLADPNSWHVSILSRLKQRNGRRKSKMSNNAVCRHRVVDSSSGCVVWLKWWFKMREAITLK